MAANVLQAMWRGYYQGLAWLVGIMSLGIGRVGRFTTQRPGVVMGCSLAFIVLCCLGWTRFHTESRADHLWCVPAVCVSRAEGCMRLPSPSWVQFSAHAAPAWTAAPLPNPLGLAPTPSSPPRPAPP